MKNVKKDIVIYSSRTEGSCKGSAVSVQVFTYLLALSWSLERNITYLEPYIREIGLWLRSSGVPLWSWVKSLAAGGIRRSP